MAPPRSPRRDAVPSTGGGGAVLHTVDEVCAALTGLAVQRAEQYRRPVQVDGAERFALDTVVRAVLLIALPRGI